MQFCRLLFACLSWCGIANSTERTEVYLEWNKAVRVNSGLEKMWTVVLISWIIFYIKGKIYTYILILFFLPKIRCMIDFIKSQVSWVDFWNCLYIYWHPFPIFFSSCTFWTCFPCREVFSFLLLLSAQRRISYVFLYSEISSGSFLVHPLCSSACSEKAENTLSGMSSRWGMHRKQKWS